MPEFLKGFGSLRKRYIIDIWQGSEYPSGSKHVRVKQGSEQNTYHRYLIGF